MTKHGFVHSYADEDQFLTAISPHRIPCVANRALERIAVRPTMPRNCIAAWAFKHPKPADFFRAMESEAGEDLSWWWRGWYENTWQLDLAVTGVGYVNGDPAQGAQVKIEARDKLILPATLRVTYADGKASDIRLPAETWIRQGSTTVSVPGTTKIVRAELDPDHVLPDRDRANNVWLALPR